MNIYVGTLNGHFNSLNDGESWRNMGLRNGIGGFAFSIDPVNPNNLYYGMIQQLGFFKSTNGGLDRTQSNRGLTTRRLLSLAVAVLQMHYVFPGTSDRGVFRSTDRGESWSEFSQSLPPEAIATLVYDLQTHTRYAGREHDPNATGGVYSLKLRPTTVLLKEDDVGPKLHVPNPFNFSFLLEYFLPKPDRAKIEVTDVRGREVATPVNRTLQAGTYNVSFDGSNLPSGVYFSRLMSGSFSTTRKMLLTR